MKIRNIHIDSYKIFQDFDLDLTHDGETLDFVVLAGVNGSGKTSLLEFSFFILVEEIKEFGSGFLEVNLGPGRIKKIKPSNGGLLFNWAKKMDYYPSGYDTVDDSKKIIQEFIDKLIYEENVTSQEAYQKTQKILDEIFDGFNLQVSFSGLDRKREVLFRNETSEKIPLKSLSSGEKELITKAFSLHLSDIKDSVILIDEPEFSLHPNWQSRIVKIYRDFAKKNNNQIILATHSPQIIAATPKESLRILDKQDGKVVVLDQFDGAYGMPVDQVLLEIMGASSLRTLEVEQKLTEVRNMVHENQHHSEKFQLLMEELESILGYVDRDLALIRLEMARRKLEA